MPEGKIQIHIVHDVDYQPGDTCGAIQDEAKEIAMMGNGSWSAYGICTTVGGEEIGDSVWGVVTDSGYLGTYDTSEEIGQEYLRELAAECVKNTQDSVRQYTNYYIAQDNIGTAEHEALRALDKNEVPAIQLYDSINDAMAAWTDDETSVFEVTFQVRQMSVGHPAQQSRKVVAGDG